jgi:hypothetical protein
MILIMKKNEFDVFRHPSCQIPYAIRAAVANNKLKYSKFGFLWVNVFAVPQKESFHEGGFFTSILDLLLFALNPEFDPFRNDF